MAINCQQWIIHSKKVGCNSIMLSENITPATDYPLKKKGTAEIIRRNQDRGLYFMEGVDGKDFYCVEKPIPVTELLINGETVMVDDPLHETGMRKLAAKAKGKVLVGGLGLGLIAHALEHNLNVSKVDIVEKNPDVLDLVKPHIPEVISEWVMLTRDIPFPDRPITVHKGDVFDKKWSEGDYDTIIIDLWVRSSGGPLRIAGGGPSDIMDAYMWWKVRNPDADVFIWGVNDTNINPAMTKQPCELMTELKKEMSRKNLNEVI